MPPRWGHNLSYGPPYALLQGSFRAGGAHGTDAEPHLVREEGCVMRRGMLIIIDQGPDFLIGLAHHPEWSPSYTYVADVVAEDLEVVDAIMGLPLRYVLACLQTYLLTYLLARSRTHSLRSWLAG